MAFRSARRVPEGVFAPTDQQEELQNLLEPDEYSGETDRDFLLRSLLKEIPVPPTIERSELPELPPPPEDPFLAVQKYPRAKPLEALTDLEPKTMPEAPDTFRLSSPFSEEGDAPPDRRQAPTPMPIADISDDPFERAAFRTRRGVVGDKAITEPDLPIPPTEAELEARKNETWGQWGERITRPQRFAASEVLKTGALLYDIPAAGARFLGGIEKMTPGEDAPRSARRVGGNANYPIETTMQDAASYLEELGAGTRGAVESALGVKGTKPETPLEHAGEWAGTYFFPMKGAAATAGLTLTGVAARAGLTALGGSEIPIPSMVTAAEAGPFDRSGPPPSALTGRPAPIAPAPNAPAAPAPVAPGGTVTTKPTVAPPPSMLIEPGVTHTGPGGEKKKRELKNTTAPVVPEGMYIPPPDQRSTTEPNLKKGIGRLNKKTGLREGVETDEAFAIRKENAWKLKEIAARTYTESSKAIFAAVGGKQVTDQADYRAMGVLGATVVGMAFVPKVYRMLSAGTISGVRKVETVMAEKSAYAAEIARPVRDAAEGTTAISRPQDVLRLSDDVQAPLTSILDRGGAHPDVSDAIDKHYRITTRNGGRALADSAISDGRMETPTFRFHAPVSVNEMARAATPESDNYLRLLEEAEQLRAAKNEAINKAVERQQLNPSAPGRGTWEARKANYDPVTQDKRSLSEIEQMIKDAEQANPAIVKMAEDNRAFNNELTRFREAGEYGAMTKEEANAARTSGVNHIGEKGPATAMEAKSEHVQALIKERLDNEAKGIYIDASIKAREGSFVEITKAQYDANPAWHPNVVTFKRRGEVKYYTTDPFLADVLKLDLPSVAWGGNLASASKRWLEATTTGNLAPNFAVTSAIRSYWIAKFTTEKGFSSPTALGTVMAIPQQLLPQIAKSISHGLENGGGGMLRTTFGDAWTDSFAKRMAHHYTESVYAQLKAAGSHRGSFIEQQARARGLEDATKFIDESLSKYGGSVYRSGQHFWNMWKAGIESIHNGPGFNFVVKNMGRESLPDLALRARRLTGDPRTGGQTFVGEGLNARQVRFQSDTLMDKAVVDGLARVYGWATETGKAAIPWWNPTMQGAKRIGEAYLHDPIRFARSTAMYAMAPAAALMYWAKWLDSQGGDPKGRSYMDWILNGRSAFNRQMNFSIPIWGQPVENSPEITFFHELNPFKRAIEIAIHHMLGSDIPKEDPRFLWLGMPDNVTKRRPLSDELYIAAHAFLDTAVIPPMPPAFSAAAGYMGFRAPQGAFGGQAYPVKGDPFNQNGGMPTSLELVTRSLFGGVAESLGGFYAASTQSEGGYWNAIKNGAAQVRDINIRKTPILRDVVGTLPDVSNVTDLAAEVFEHQKEFNMLDRYFKKWTVNQGFINVDPKSKGGDIAVREQYGLDTLNAGNPGLPPPEPTNPNYIRFMQEFHNAFSKESPNPVKGKDEGGIAFKSLWNNYGIATKKLADLKDVNHGSYDRWQRAMSETPAGQVALEELKQYQVDPTDKRQVVAFYRRKQFEALRVINYVRRAVENKLGVKLKDLPPYLPPSEQGEAPFMYPDLM